MFQPLLSNAAALPTQSYSTSIRRLSPREAVVRAVRGHVPPEAVRPVAGGAVVAVELWEGASARGVARALGAAAEVAGVEIAWPLARVEDALASAGAGVDAAEAAAPYR